MFERFFQALQQLEVTWQILLATGCLMIYCLNRFNSWAEDEQSMAKESPPRHYTTRNRYGVYATLYTLTLVSCFLVLLTVPGVLVFLGENFGIANLTPEMIKGKDFPLILLVIMVAIFPAMKPFRAAEEKLRTWFHHQAFIPSKATALVTQLINKPSCFSKEPADADIVLEELREYLPENVDPLQPDQDIWHNWFKLLYLRKRIADWQEDPRINQFTITFGKTYTENLASFYDLRKEMKYYARRMKAHTLQEKLKRTPEDEEYAEHEEESLDLLKRKLLKEIKQLLKSSYQYISCGILSTEISECGRREKFAFFNLSPDFEEQLPFVVDSLLMAMLFVFVITTLTSLLYRYLIFFKIDWIRALDLGLLHTLMQGFCIFIAYFTYRRYDKAGWLKPDPVATGVVVGPLLRFLVGFFVGYGPALILTVLWMTSHVETGLVEAVKKNWFWPLPVAVTTSFIIYYLSSIRDCRNTHWRDGAIQAFFQGAIGFVVALIASTQLGIVTLPDRQIALIGYITLTLSLTGWCIGRVFPHEYRKALRLHQIDRRHGQRVQIQTPAAVKAGRDYDVVPSVISLSGAGVPIEIPQDVNSPVQFTLPGLGSLLGRISRKAKGYTYLAFVLKEEEKMRLARFIENSTKEGGGLFASAGR